jgi:hypothetical protein
MAINPVGTKKSEKTQQFGTLQPPTGAPHTIRTTNCPRQSESRAVLWRGQPTRD